MIPKIIHYCWLGKKPLPPLAQKCLESWKKYCPDYEIKRWDESNLPIEQYSFMKEAYEAKAWAFVPDMARLLIVYQNGGIYLDTDVEVIKSLDPLLNEQAFFGIEKDKGKINDPPFVNLGQGFGAEAGAPIVKELLKYYETAHFLKADGSPNKIASPMIQTRDFIRLGWKRRDEQSQVCGATIYPSVYFDPKSPFSGEIAITGYTYSIHHYDGSWLPHSPAKRKILCVLRRNLGEKRYEKLKKLLKSGTVQNEK